MSNGTRDNTTPPRDAISLIEILNAVLRNWRMVLLLPLVLAVATAAWTLTRERTYAAAASFMPQSPDGGGMGDAAALAQQFGVNIASDGSGQSPEFYVELIESVTLLRRIAEAPYEVPRAGGAFSGTLIEYWELDEERGNRPPWLRAVEKLQDDIDAGVSRETGIVRVIVSADHPALAEQIAAKLVGMLNEFNLEVRQNRAEEEARFISGRVTEAAEELLQAERSLQDFLQQNREFRSTSELRFQQDRLERQVAMRQDLYTSLLRSQEEAQIDAVRDLPLLTVIDHPGGTAEPERRGLVKRTLLAILLGLGIAVLFSFVRESARRSRETQDPNYSELEWLLRTVGSDLRHPGRWLRRAATRT